MIPTFIVDDVQSDRYIASRRLKKAGVFGPLHEASGGREFLEHYLASASDGQATLPALILMDINMPELNGFETLEEMERCLPEGAKGQQVVVLFSSSDNERDIERARQSGIVAHFFTKPINDASLGAILDGYRARGHAI